MTVTIQLGGLSDGEFRDDNVAFPFIPQLATVALMQAAIQQAIAHRVGVLVFGPKGSGKTEARRYALEELQALEDEREQADGNYQRRSLLLLPAVRENQYDRALVGLMSALTNGSPALLTRGRRKSNEELRHEFIDQCLLQNRVLIVVEELERASPAFLHVLRDIMTDAKERDRSGVVEVNGERHLRPAGIGILGIGTEVAKGKIQGTPEAGHGWASTHEVSLLAPGDVAALFCLWFPRFAETIALKGDGWWDALIGTRLCDSRPRAIRAVMSASRLYMMYMGRLHDGVVSPKQVPLQDDVLLKAWQDAHWSDGTSGTGRGTTPDGAA